MSTKVNENGECVCFVNTLQTPLKVEHVCYFTQDSFDDNTKVFLLYEVVYKTYPHPDAPEHATVKLMTTRFVKQVKDTDPKEVGLLRSIQQTVRDLDLQNRSR